MRLIFENERGRVTFGGEAWRLIAISGLELPQKTFSTMQCVGIPGQITTEFLYEPRVITLRAECRAEGCELRLAQELRVLNEAGVMTIATAQRERRIACYLSQWQEGERNALFRTFVMQFVCDSPFFCAMEAETHAVLVRRDVLEVPFVIGDGVVLSERRSEAVVRNDGDVAAEPKITILGGEGNTLTIANVTTGGRVTLTLTEEDHEVTIDTPTRAVYNQNGDNLLAALSLDSYLHTMQLERGDNRLRVMIAGELAPCSVTCRFTKQYLELNRG